MWGSRTLSGRFFTLAQRVNVNVSQKSGDVCRTRTFTLGAFNSMISNVYNKADKEDVKARTLVKRTKIKKKKRETWQISKMAGIKIFTVVLKIVINSNV